MKQLIIGAVFEKDSTTPKHQEIIGRKGIIHNIEVGFPLMFKYIDEELKGYHLRTSSVKEVDETDHGVWVTTTNSVYRFDNVDSMVCKHCGKTNRKEANFCTHCGKKLKETCNCWMKNGQPHNCGSESCPGYKLPVIEKSKL